MLEQEVRQIYHLQRFIHVNACSPCQVESDSSVLRLTFGEENKNARPRTTVVEAVALSALAKKESGGVVAMFSGSLSLKL
jgi:hypothetical protein